MANSLESLRKLKEKLSSQRTITKTDNSIESLRKLKEKLSKTDKISTPYITKQRSLIPEDKTKTKSFEETQNEVRQLLNRDKVDMSKIQDIRNTPVDELNKKVKNITTKVGLTALDYMSRPVNAVTNVFKESEVMKQPEYTYVDGKLYKVINKDIESKKDIGSAFIKGITGEERPEALEMFFSKNQIEKMRKIDPAYVEIGNFTFGSLADPLTYVGAGVIKNVALKVLGKMPVKLADKVAKGTAKLTDLVEATGKTEKEVQRLIDSEINTMTSKVPKLESTKLQNVANKLEDTNYFASDALKPKSEVVNNITAETIKNTVKEGTEQKTNEIFRNENNNFSAEEILQEQKKLPETVEEIQSTIDNLNKQIKKEIDPILLRNLNLQLFAADDKLKKVSEFKTNSMKNAPLLQSEDLQNIVDDIDAIYGVKTDKDSIAKAKQMVDGDFTGTLKRIRGSKAFESKEDVAASWYILKKFVDDNDTKNISRWLDITQPKVTSTAQSLQGVSLYKKLSPEGALMEAQKTVKKSEEGIKKANPDKFKKVDEETKQITDELDKADKEVAPDIVDDINKKAQEIKGKNKTKDNNPQKPKEAQPKEELKSEEILAKKIEDYTKDPKTPEDDPIKDMVNELFRVAQESPIEKAKIKSKDAIEFVGEALKNRQKFVDTWKKAKEIVREKFKDNPDALVKLEQYFDKGIKPPFSTKSFNKAITEGMKNLNLNIGEIVRDYYNTGSKSRQDLVDYLVEKAGIEGQDAQTLAKYIQNKMKDLTKEKREQLLKSMFKVSEKTPPKSPLKSIEELSNLGAFKNENYKNLVGEKLTPKLQKLIKESNIDLGEIVRKGVNEVDFTRTKFLKEISEKLKVDDRDAKTILEAIEKKFNELADEKRGSIFNVMFKKRPQIARKSQLDKIVELANMGGLDDSTIRNLVKEKYKIPTLTDDVVADIIKQSKDIQAISEKGLTNLLDLLEKKARLDFTINKLNKVTTVEKITSFNYIQQLFGTLTQIRNLAGNESMYRSWRLSKYPASLIDWTKSKLFGAERQITFTKDFNPWTSIKEYTSNLSKGAKAGWKGYNLIGSSGDKFNIAHKNFTGKWNPFNYMESMLGATLNGFDYAAYMRGVKERLYELAYTSVKNSGQKVSKETIQKYMDNIGTDIFEMAEETGKYLTLRDKNNLSQGLNYVKNAANKIGIGEDVVKSGMTTKPFGFGNIIMNYPQSTGALVKAAFDYSPAGFLNSLLEISRPILSKARLMNPVDPAVHYTKIVDSFSKALVGTLGFTGLGYYLYNVGVITADAPEDTEAAQMMQNVGYPKYSININALGRWIQSGFNKESAQPQNGDNFYSYNWLQPVGLSVSLGANYGQNMKDKGNEGKHLLSAIGSSIEGAASTLADQSLLTGVSKFIQGYSGQDILQSTTESLLTGMTGQYAYQVRKLVDNVKRNVDSDDPLVKLTNVLKNKYPGLSKTLPETINTLGETSELYQGGTNNILNVLFNPGFVSKYKPSAGTKLILDLYKQTGETKQFPRKAGKTLTYNGKKINLTPEEVAQLQKNIGEQTLYNLNLFAEDKYVDSRGRVKSLPKNQLFTTMKPEDQVEMIYTMLNQVGKYGRGQLIDIIGEKALEERAK
jgi:hypothetical protein